MEQKRKAGRNRRGRSKRRRELQLRIELLAAVAVVLTIISVAVIQGSRARAEQEAREAAAQTERIQKIRKSSEATPVPTEEPESGTVIQIRMVGDVILHEDVCNSCLQNTGYQFDGLFCNISGEIREADIAIANQETILGGTGLGITGWPEFNSPCEAGDALVSAGFRVILQASNHTLDYGIEGVTNCLNYWKTTHPEAAVLGIHGDRQAAEDIYVYEKDGFRVAILNYTYGTNLNEELLQDENTAYLLNVLDEERVTADVARAKEMADFVIVCPHWGIEDDNNVCSEQQYWCDLFLSLGVDLVLGAHPHVIQPVEMKMGENGHQMLVYYSLGNCVSNQEHAYAMVGAMAEVTIRKDQEGVHIDKYGIEPLVTHEGQNPQSFTTYLLRDYTEELAGSNGILQDDSSFSLQYCQNLCREVFGNLYQ